MGWSAGGSQALRLSGPTVVRRASDHLLTAYLTAAAFSLVGVGFEQRFESAAAHAPLVASLLVAGVLAAAANWYRMRLYPSSRSTLLFVAFALLAGVYGPHTRLSDGGIDPELLIFGPASRAAFGLVLAAAVAGMPVPGWLRRRPRAALGVAVLLVLLLDALLWSTWYRSFLLDDPIAVLRGTEWVAVGAQVVALLVLLAQRLRGRFTPFGAALERAVVAMLVSSGLFLTTVPWTWRWWVAHIGLFVTASLITSAILLERSRQGSLAGAADLDVASTVADILLDEYPAGVASMTPDGAVLTWNPAARALTGWERATAQQRVAELADGRREIDGTPIGVRSIDVRSAGRSLRLVFLDDISNEVALESENQRLDEMRVALEQALGDRDRLVGVVAHELRNPLGAVRGFAETLEMRMGDHRGETEAVLLRRIVTASDRMLSLVDDLLSLTRIGGRGLAPRLTRRDVDLADVVDVAVDLHRAAAEHKGLVIEVDADRPAKLWADEAKLEQVVDNLLSNAIKYSPAGSTVRVAVVARDHSVQLTVADEGQGIELDEQTVLFEPFVTTSSKPTAGEPSTGLGLAIVDAIVKGHGGTIAVDSAPGQGAAFTVVLPRNGDDQAEAKGRSGLVSVGPHNQDR